jgi:hydrogenase expression/formation protein HypD
MGWRQYEAIAQKYHVPVVVTGFEPLDLLAGVLAAVRQLESGQAIVENQYARMVSREGNLHAQELINEVFEVCDRAWRGIGVIPNSGLRLRDKYAAFDAERIFNVDNLRVAESTDCISGIILQGIKKPVECPHFGKRCTPATPLGATMISSEGACAAYYNYHRYFAVPES